MHVLLVGLGNMGKKYFTKLQQMGEPLVLCDLDPSKAKEGYPFYCHFGEVKEELKAVIVAVNPEEHIKIAEEFLKKGVRVLLEKPPALRSEEFLKIKDYENLFVSEVESYSVCAEFLKKPERFIRIERFGRGRGYISPLWDLAWHDLYLLQKVSERIEIKELSVEGDVWTLRGFVDEVPFTLSVAWEHPQPRRLWNIDDELLLDFGEERVYAGRRLLIEDRRDKLQLMLRDFLAGVYDRGTVERAFKNLLLLESIS